MKFISLSAFQASTLSLSLLVAVAACSSSGDGVSDGSGSSSSGDGDGDTMGGDGDGDVSMGDGDGDSSGGGNSGGGTSSSHPEGEYLFPNQRGPKVTFKTYEAEDMSLSGGSQLGPTRAFGQVAAEASGRRAVRLSATGDSVSFVNSAASNSIVVRYSIPATGSLQERLNDWRTLTVFVDGEERKKLDLTTRYSWSYRNGAENDNIFNTDAQKEPSGHEAHHFFDETRALIGDIPVGSTVTLKKEASDTASHYDIDLIEMEQVAAPLKKPIGYAHLVNDCGATDNGDADDDTAAFQKCVDEYSDGVYIPAGEFHIKSRGIEVQPGSRIIGAGMWHSKVMGRNASFVCFAGDCQYRDFSIFGDTVARYDSPDTGTIEGGFTAYDVAFKGNNNSDVVVDHLWVEHRRVAYWTDGGGNNIQIRNSRFRNLHADAINFYGGATNSVVEHCHSRNTGDDALAAWSHGTRPVNSGNSFNNNYIQVPWKANCIAIYGGNDSVVADNVCEDVLQYPGIYYARSFSSHAFGGSHQVNRNTVTRAGGGGYGWDHGAFMIHAAQDNVDNIHVDDMEIIDSSTHGIHLDGKNYIGNTSFNNVKISNSTGAGIFISHNTLGAADFSNVHVTGNGLNSGGSYGVNRGSGNSGW